MERLRIGQSPRALRDRKSAPSQITPDFWKKFLARNTVNLTYSPFLKSLFRFLDPCGIYFIYRCIGTNQSDPIAAIDLERHVVKERPAGERF